MVAEERDRGGFKRRVGIRAYVANLQPLILERRRFAKALFFTGTVGSCVLVGR